MELRFQIQKYLVGRFDLECLELLQGLRVPDLR